MDINSDIKTKTIEDKAMADMNAINSDNNNNDNSVQEVITEDTPKDSPKEASIEDMFAFSDSPTLEEIRRLHSVFVKERDWDQFHSPRNILLAFVAEVGELSELFQWKNECEVGLKDWSPKERTSLEEELSDCLIYLVRLADRCRVDLPTALLSKMAKNEAKYPVNKVFGSSKKYTEYQ